MAQQTSPQEHPHTDPRTNEPSEQTPFTTEKGTNQQEYPGYVGFNAQHYCHCHRARHAAHQSCSLKAYVQPPRWGIG